MTSATIHVPCAPLPLDCRDAAAVLNRGCICTSTDHDLLRGALTGEALSAGREAGAVGISYSELLETRPYLFSDSQVYVAEAHLQAMVDLIEAIERVVALPAWHERALAQATDIARHDQGTAGAFLGYDFHLGAEGPQLIEINTNAGGGLLNAKLLSAQRSCCVMMDDMLPERIEVESDFVAMFRQEWKLARGDRPLNRIAIVDETPGEQFLAAEFELFRQLFEANGIAAVIVDPRELSFNGEGIVCNGQIVDLIYNRLTDFSFEEERNAALRAAFLADAVVVTPHPRAHALYADKRNLITLTDESWLKHAGVSETDRRALKAGIPPTEAVTPDNAASFWASRKQWFFKTAAGFGSKAAYRGDKLTKRVFEEISRGGYVAQAVVPPSERRLLVDGVEQDLKLDLRNYVYRSEVQLVSARLYQGQTTNFRTPGGGFAAVFSVGCGGQAGR